MSPVEWFYARDNRQQGPVSALELKQLAQTGQLKPDDLVWREGMGDWLPAGKVKGLFEEDGAKGPAKGPALSGAGATFEASAAAFERSREGPPRHFFDHFLESARLQFTPHFVEATSRVLAVAGHYGLYAAMVVLFTFNVVLAARTTNLYLIVLGLAWALALVVLQYIAGRFTAATEKLNRATPGRMSSTAFLDCWALLFMLAGLIVLIGVTLLGLHLEIYYLLLSAVGLFVLLQFVAILAINPDTVHIEIVSETGAGEEAIGILSLLAKVGLRVVPVVFGIGVILGAAWMLIACWLALVPPQEAKTLAIQGLGRPGQESADREAPQEAKTAAIQGLDVMLWPAPEQYAPAVGMALLATRTLVVAAAFPFLMYMAFLLYFLGIDLVRAVFSLPTRLESLRPPPVRGREEG